MNVSRLPDFIIVGAQKSASTFVQDALSAHPDVYMPHGETRFFEDPEYGDGALAPLHAIFAGRPERLVGIKRPDYLGREEVPQRIRAVVPEAKIIAVLRNPVDRLVSAYYHYIKFGFIPALDINKGLSRLLAGEPLGNPKTPELLAYGKYATHLRRYYAQFRADQILVILQEDIARAAQATLANVGGFLGIDAGALAAPPRAANKGIYSGARLRFITRRNRFLYDYDRETGKVIDKQRSFGRTLAVSAITAVDRYVLGPVLNNDAPRLDADIRAQLVAYYRDEVAQTRDILGRELKGWD